MAIRAALLIVALGGLVGHAAAEPEALRNRQERPEPTREVAQPIVSERTLSAAELAPCLASRYIDEPRNPNPQSFYSPGATAKLVEFLNKESVPADRTRLARAYVVTLKRKGLLEFNESKYGRVCYYRLVDRNLTFISSVNLERDGRADSGALGLAFYGAMKKFS